MKLIFYDKTNVDHILFCLFYNQIYNGIKTNKILFDDFTSLEHYVFLPDIKYEIIFLDYLPHKEWLDKLDNVEPEYKYTYVLYTTLPLSINQLNNETVVVTNIYDNSYINYHGIFLNYIYCENSLSNFINNELVTVNLNHTEKELLQIIKQLISFFNYDNGILSDKYYYIHILFKKYFSNISIYDLSTNNQIIILHKYITNDYYSFSFEHNITNISYNKQFNELYYYGEFNILYYDNQKNFVNFINNKDEFFTPTNTKKSIKVFTINTTNISESIMLHNFYVQKLNNLFSSEFTYTDLIEYYNPLNKQSVFIPVEFNNQKYFLHNLTSLNNPIINYFNDNIYIKNILIDYHKVKYDIVETYSDTINKINPLLNIYQKNKYNSYNNNIGEFLSTKYNLNLTV